MVNEINVPGDKIVVVAGNDVESWYDEIVPGWAACGKGTINWFTGFKDADNAIIEESRVIDPLNARRPMRILNFGSNAWGEYPEQWSTDDLYRVFMSGSLATGFNVEAHPQVYCNNPIYVTRWADFAEIEADKGRTVFFAGITSDNAGSLRCSNQTARSLSWQTAWLIFDQVIESRSSRALVSRSAISYYLPPLDIDSP